MKPLRGEATLADESLYALTQKNSILAKLANRPVHELRSALVRARRFVLDDAMSAFMADLSTAVYRTADKDKTLDSMRHSAMLPHPVMWVEWNGKAMRRRLQELDMSYDLIGDALAGPDDVCPRWGLLMEQHPKVPTAARVTEFLMVDVSDIEEEGHAPVAMPFSHVWQSSDDPLPWHACHDSGMIAHGIIGYRTQQIGTLLPPRDFAPKDWVEVVTHDKSSSFTTHKMVIETAGVVRYALSFLAALNDLPAIKTEVIPTKGWFARGQYKKYLTHSVLQLNIPAKKNHTRVAQRLVTDIHRRAHICRGHFRKYERKADLDCQHAWGAIADDGRSRCANCPSWRTWIEQHQRGDASLGLVQHDYQVHHPKP